MNQSVREIDPSGTGLQRLLEAAAVTFSERGYAASSIAVIARRAGLSKSTVFHHFPSKEALYLAVIRVAVEDFGQRLDHALSAAEDLPSALRRFQCEHIRHMACHRQVVRLIMRELQDPALEHKRPLVIELLSSNFTRLVGHLESARQAGRIRSTSHCQVTALILFATNAFLFQHAGELADIPGLELAANPEEFADAFIDLLYNGLGPEAAYGAEQ